MEQTPMYHPEDFRFRQTATIAKNIQLSEVLRDQSELAEADYVDLGKHFSDEELADLQSKANTAGMSETEADEYLRRQVLRFRQVHAYYAAHEKPEEPLELVSFVDKNIAAIKDGGYGQI